MPERFNFACFLEGLNLASPRPALDAAAALFGARLGTPTDTMVLNYRSERHVNEPWPNGEHFLRQYPGPTELVFVYYIGRKGGRPCIHFAASGCALVMTISLEDMAIEKHPGEVADLCLKLHALCRSFARRCVVAAAGEIEFETELGTAAGALAAELHGSNTMAQWIACDADCLPEDHEGFDVVARSPDTALLGRPRSSHV